MAHLFGSVLGGIAGTLLRSFSDGGPPDSVLEVKAEEYTRQPVIDREDCLTLYGPFRETYDIVLQIPFHNSTQNVFRYVLQLTSQVVNYFIFFLVQK